MGCQARGDPQSVYWGWVQASELSAQQSCSLPAPGGRAQHLIHFRSEETSPGSPEEPLWQSGIQHGSDSGDNAPDPQELEGTWR